ncbi:MAG: nuclear transport factor 2 family protein [Acidimicrobiales bacterium]
MDEAASPGPPVDDPGERFARALGAKDAAALKTLLAPDVDFRALTPGEAWESRDRNEVVDDIFFGEWLEPHDHVTDVLSVETDAVGPRCRVGYRFALTNPDGRYQVEQQAYFDVRDEQISWLRIVCSGYQPDPDH